jgi:hypothetical protein
MKRTPIKRVSKKRSAALGIYSQLRKQYLARHPWCEVYCKRFGVDYKELFATNGAYCIITPVDKMRYWRLVPLATDIHHLDGRTGERLNDDKKWLAACREQHQWTHAHPSEARKLGLLI